MCGILGVAWPNLDKFDYISTIKPMLTSMEHRGPDGEGVWTDSSFPIALAHRRLAVVELTSAGAQPMISASGRFVIVFNGEIYNHIEMRKDLDSGMQAGSINWRGSSDTETLLAYIEAMGLKSAVQAAVGMFAFAIWDCKEKQLSLVRDRIGEKPLYYGTAGGCFVFSSELKAIKRINGFSASVDVGAISDYLRFNYIPAPYTIYNGIFKARPGYIYTWNKEAISGHEDPREEAYWSLSTSHVNSIAKPFVGSYEDAVDQLDFLLKQSVRSQSFADVPLGAFLSGGIDSTAVVALMKEMASADVRTFSIGMPDPSFDESGHASEVAKYLGTRHVNHMITAREALDFIPAINTIWDEPFSDSSQIPTYLVSKIARQHVTVALSGDGGDEFFYGYSHHQRLKNIWQWRFLRALPTEYIRATIGSASNMPRLARLCRKIDLVDGAWHRSNTIDLADYWADKYKGKEIPLQSNIIFSRNKRPDIASYPSSAIGGAAFWDAHVYLPDDILVKVDRASMANSLETRAPLLDHRIIEFSLSLPEEYKMSRKTGKQVLRSVLYRRIPKSMVDRPKMGFSIPLSKWLKQELKPWGEDLIATVRNHDDLLNPHEIRRIWNEHINGVNDHTDKVWAFLILLGFLQ